MDQNAYERLAQILSATSVELSTLQQLVQNEAESQALALIRVGLQELEQMTQEALALVHQSFIEHLPTEIEHVSLIEQLSRMAEESAERQGISSRITFSGLEETNRSALAPIVERLLYLFTHETLYEIEQLNGVQRLRLAVSYVESVIQVRLEAEYSSVPETARQENVLSRGPLPFALTPDTRRLTQALQQPTFTPVFADLARRFEQLGGKIEISMGEQRVSIQAHLPVLENRSVVSLEEGLSAEQQTINSSSPPPALPAPPVRVLLVDSQTVTRAGLRRLLEAYPALQVIGEASDGIQAASETVELGPQVVLMDMHLSDGRTLETLRQMKQLNPDTRVLLLANDEREEALYETLRAGADGYVLKTIAPDELVRAIQAVAQGEILIQPQIAGRLLVQYGQQGPPARNTLLTAREQDVLQLLVRGLRNKEIAARLFVSERTVNFHLANIYQKLNVSGRTEALSKALERGLVTS
jgi:DNA-binding NarL/FixJ family response regulator